MKKKTCVACNKTKYGLDYAVSEDTPDWVKNTGKIDTIIPLFYMPKMENVFKVDISVPELKNSIIYYWASESERMKKSSKNQKDCQPQCHPEYAYGNYCNSGITKLDNLGSAEIYIEKPIAYYVEDEGYYPHLHFTTYNKKTNNWNQEVFTVAVK